MPGSRSGPKMSNASTASISSLVKFRSRNTGKAPRRRGPRAQTRFIRLARTPSTSEPADCLEPPGRGDGVRRGTPTWLLGSRRSGSELQPSDVSMALPNECQHNLRARCQRPDGVHQPVCIANRLAANLDDDVTGLEPRPCSGPAGYDGPVASHDLSTVSGEVLIDRRTDDGMRGVSRPDELLYHAAREVHRYRETQPDAATLRPGDRVAAERVYGRVHADDLATGVDERATRVAGVDRRICLNGVEEDRRRVSERRGGLHRAVDGADDATGDGVGQAEWRADRDHRVADGHTGRVADSQGRKVGDTDRLDDSNVG